MANASDPRERAATFAIAARCLCNTLERPSTDKTGAALELLQGLAQVYALALALDLPGDHSGVPDLDDAFPVSDDARAKVIENVASIFGERSSYWLQADPIFPRDGSDEPVCGDLGDDFHDIYRDILPALLAWESGSNRFDDILREWRVTAFEHHWGVHASHALHALHLIVFNHGVGSA